MLSPISLAAFSTTQVVTPPQPLASSPTGPLARPFADPARQGTPSTSQPAAPGTIPPRGSLLDLSV